MSTKPKEPEKTYGLMTGLEVRAVNTKARTADFVAATEGGVETFFGREFLDMDGLSTERFLKNPVVLDTHNRSEAGAVIGNATLKVEGRKLINRVEFATTDRANDIWELVRSGFIRAVSVGFLPKQVLNIEEGETHKLGDAVIDGPARIITKWDLFEVSIVPVPADPDAVRRAYIDGDTTGIESTAKSFARTLAHICSHAAEGKEKELEIKPPAKEERQMTTKIEEAPKKEEATKKEENREAGPAYEREAIDAEIRGICSQFPNEGTRCVIGEMTVEQSRVHMRQYLAEKSPPAGANGDTNQSTKTEEKREVSADVILRSIGV